MFYIWFAKPLSTLKIYGTHITTMDFFTDCKTVSLIHIVGRGYAISEITKIFYNKIVFTLFLYQSADISSPLLKIHTAQHLISLLTYTTHWLHWLSVKFYKKWKCELHFAYCNCMPMYESLTYTHLVLLLYRFIQGYRYR